MLSTTCELWFGEVEMDLCVLLLATRRRIAVFTMPYVTRGGPMAAKCYIRLVSSVLCADRGEYYPR